MPRGERKGSVVETVRNDKTQREAKVRMEKGTFYFFCRLPDEDVTAENAHSREYFESKDAHEVREWARQHIKKSEKKHRLDWKPVIRVDFDRPERYHRNRDDEKREVRLSAELTRFYVALSHDKTQWLKLDWAQVDEHSATALDEDDRLAQAEKFWKGPKAPKDAHSWHHSSSEKPFTLPLITGDRSYVAYTEELWAGLNEVLNALENSADTLVDMLGTKKGLVAIAQVGAGVKRLTAGTIAAEDNPNH